MIDFRESLREKFLKYFGCAAEEGFIEACFKHFGLLLRFNEMFNLTRIIEVEESVLCHYIDSVFVATAHEDGLFRDGVSIADIGTGGGFPAFPLYFYLAGHRGVKNLKMTLIESSKKKCEFLKTVVFEMGLNKVITVLSERVEDVGTDPAHRERYDVVTARAVSSLPVLLEYSVPLLKVGGKCLFMKGEDIDVEKRDSKKALSELKAELKKDFVYEIENMQYKRRVVIVKKFAETPKKYPRKAGIPKKTPLA